MQETPPAAAEPLRGSFVHEVPRYDPWRGHNPVVWRERLLAERASADWRQRWGLGGRWPQLPVMVWLIVALLTYPCCLPFVVSVQIGWGLVATVSFALSGAGLWVMLPLSLLALPPHLAPSICRERELGTWDILRSTPLSRRQIVLGKLFAGISQAPMLGTLVVLGPLQALWAALMWNALSPVGGVGLSAVVFTAALLLVLVVQPLVDVVYAACLLLAVSALSSSTPRAVAVGYVALGVTYVLPVTALGLVGNVATIGSAKFLGITPLLTPLYALAIPVLLAVTLVKTWQSE